MYSRSAKIRHIRNVTLPSIPVTQSTAVDVALIARIQDKAWVVRGNVAHINDSEEAFKIDFEEFCENTGRTFYHVKGKHFHRDPSGIFRLIQSNS